MALITATEIIDRAFTNANTDTYLIKDTFIDVAELNHLRPFLGDNLYDTVVNEFSASTVWNSTLALGYTVKCQADVAGSLHHLYLDIHSSNDANRYAVYFDVTGVALAIPAGYTGVIAVDLTTSGVGSTAIEVATALQTVLDAHADFTASISVDSVTITGITGMTNPSIGTATGFIFSGGGYSVTSGSTIITCLQDDFIKVGDFVTGTGIPINSDSSSEGLCKVDTVDTPGAVTSFTISGTPNVTNAVASLTFRRPNGVLKEDFIMDYLAFCVKFEVLPDITYNTTSQGAVDNFADFTSPISESKLNFLRQETYKKAETFKKKTRIHLQKNCKSYPKWRDDTAGGVSKKHGLITY
jgi:hypothetical protein|tara:strand:+ start:7499 stop:8563 length:1065 start_codon:yes stop_codon:yes gene_type:complete